MGFKLRKPFKAQRVLSDQDTNELDQKSRKNSKLHRLSKYLKSRTKGFHKKSSDHEALRISQSNSAGVDQLGEATHDSDNTQTSDTSPNGVRRVATPVQQKADTTAVLESGEPTEVPEIPRVVEITEAVPYWEAIVDVITDSPAASSPQQPSLFGSDKTVIRTRKNPSPSAQTHSRDTSDTSTLPVSLRTSASDSCLVAKHRIFSQLILLNDSGRSTETPEDPLETFIDLKLKSEKAWELLLKTREVGHANQIAALKDEHVDAINELKEAKAQFEQGLERADRSKTYLQKQVKQLRAAKDDADKAAKAAQDQLAKQQAEHQEAAKALQQTNMQPQAQYQELAITFHWENVARKAAEENCEALKAQLALYREQYVTRDNALSRENSRLLGVVSEIQLKNHELTFEQMRHVSCIPQEQYMQAEEEYVRARDRFKEELVAAQFEVEATRRKNYELLEAVEGTASEDLFDQANTIKMRTKQVEDLSEQVKQLATEYEKVVREKVTLEVKSKISSEAFQKQVSRLVASKDTLEKQLAAQQKAHGELLAYPRDLIRTSKSKIIEAGSKALESLREEKDILAASLVGNMAAREAAEQEVAVLKLRYHDLEAKFAERAEKMAELDWKMIMSDGQAVRAEVQTEVVRYEKDKLIKEKDKVITGLQEVSQEYLQFITRIGQQSADTHTAWVLQFQAKEIAKVKEDLKVVEKKFVENDNATFQIVEDYKKDAGWALYQDHLFRQVSRDLHDCQDELIDCRDELRASEFECENLKAKVLLLKGLADPAQSGKALRNAFAQSQEQAATDSARVGAPIASAKSESWSSVQTVIKHETSMSGLDALYINYRNERLTPEQRKKVEEIDRQLTEEEQTEEYQFPELGKSLPTARVASPAWNRVYAPANSTTLQLTALPIFPPGNSEGRQASEDSDRQLAEKLQAAEYQSAASDIFPHPKNGASTTPESISSSSVVLPDPITRPETWEDFHPDFSHARPDSPRTSFRAPLGDDYFYYHYDEWLANKGLEAGKNTEATKSDELTKSKDISKSKKMVVEDSITLTPYDNMTDKEYHRIRDAGIRAATAANRERGYQGDLSLQYYLTDEELMASGSYTHDEIEQMLSPEQLIMEESIFAASGISNEDEMRISRLLENANWLPFAGYEYVEEFEEEDEAPAKDEE
ncbi:hypothetical protein MMC30_005361 [Trapelia coarctata]|nr:hypothetical protein [Trapelia coarctata]